MPAFHLEQTLVDVVFHCPDLLLTWKSWPPSCDRSTKIDFFLRYKTRIFIQYSHLFCPSDSCSAIAI